MPARSKIVDEGEVIRWFEEGRTYEWMRAEYRRKYNIETTISMWGNFRVRRGLSRRAARDESLIPWAVKSEHRWLYPLIMLRAEGRRRAGLEQSADTLQRLESWIEGLHADNAVVHYEPDTDEGFFYVPRRDGVDLDIIRKPERPTTQRHAVD